MKNKKRSLRPVDAPLYRYWNALYMSFYSSRLYVDVFKRWKGRGVLYLLFISVLLAIPLAVQSIQTFGTFFEEQIITPIEKLPLLYVQNGKISINKPTPYKIKNKQGEVVAVVDPRGDIDSLTNTYPNLSILVVEDEIYFRIPTFQFLTQSENQFNDAQVYAEPIPAYANEIFDPKQWLEESEIFIIKYLFQGLIYPILVGVVFGVSLIFLFTFAFLGQILALSFLDVKIKYKEACRLFAVAATPQMIILNVFSFLKIAIPGSAILYTIIWGGYFFYAIVCIKWERKKMVRL